jgi:hypothetical protein
VSFYYCKTFGVVPAPCTSTSSQIPPDHTLIASGPHTSTAVMNGATFKGGPAWVCFLAKYSGDSNYAPVSDNDTATECFFME